MALLQKIKGCLSFFGSGFLLLLILVILFRLFIAEPFVVRGSSMDPNFHDGDYLWIEKISIKTNKIQRGEVVIFEAPDAPSTVYIKRIIALPNERIKISKGNIYIIQNNLFFKLEEPEIPFKTTDEIDVTLGPEQFFVMGDNRSVSEDSRFFGPIEKTSLVGKAWLRLLPSSARGFIKIPNIQLNPISAQESKQISDLILNNALIGLNFFW